MFTDGTQNNVDRYQDETFSCENSNGKQMTIIVNFHLVKPHWNVFHR